ncbi:MAG: 2-hydroxyacyl-CoA dehydratase [Spirochaetes bacterium]|nr:2-hydroxyacyl-CoA dehydratase [Spirochaetota bacterium]
MIETAVRFADLLEDPRNALVEEAIEKGMIPIGYACSMVPEALLSVGRLFPVRLRAPGVAGTEMADIYLSSVICSYTRSLLEFALDGRYDFLRGFVFVASCDHLRRLHDNLDYLSKPEFSHILDVPHRRGEAALEWTVEELRRLAAALEGTFGVDMGTESIRKAIASRNEMNRLLREIGEMRKADAPPFTGTEYHRLIMAAQAAPFELMRPLAEEFLDRAKDYPGRGGHRARVLVTGTGLDDPGYTEIIESQGALVVADRYCTGSFPGFDPVDEGDEPFTAMARRVLDGSRCPRMMEEFSTRAEYIAGLAREYRADGVVIESIKFCDTWGVESAALSTRLREEGIPVLRLEREYRQSGEGQLRTRIQAFIESMGK